MNLKNFYEQVVKLGADRDPRRDQVIRSYADTAVLYGADDTPIEKIMVGIDIEVGEIILADRIRERNSLDLVVAHHPEGSALAAFYKVMQLQVDLLIEAGLKKSGYILYLQWTC